MCDDVDIEQPKDVAALHSPPSSNPRSQSLHPEMVAGPEAAQLTNGVAASQTETAQSVAVERLVKLKGELREADNEAFWERLLQGVAAVCDAQCAFVAQAGAAETGQPREATGAGTQLVGEQNENGTSFPEDIRVYVDGCLGESAPNDCTALLRTISHRLVASDEVSLVPERLHPIMDYFPSGDTFPMEAYLAVPLFSEGRCFARFGVMWTREGLDEHHVSWPYVEMILHSLEDLILFRISTQSATRKNGYHRNHHHLQSQGLSMKKDRESESKHEPGTSSNERSPCPYHPPNDSPSFKPYARSLSHELRTPMQGVVGMLDVMHATVQDAIVTQSGPNTRSVFGGLRESIEAVQDSARRAIEAADNVVHAYDLNMQVPDTPEVSVRAQEGLRTNLPQSGKSTSGYRRKMVIEGSDISVPPPAKRAKNGHAEWSYASVHPPGETSSQDLNSYNALSALSADVKSVVEESDMIVHATPQRQMEEVLIDAVSQRPQLGHERAGSPNITPEPVFPPMVLHHTRIRDLLHLVINESLHVGDRPESTTAEATTLGERIEIRLRSSSGQASTKVIDWSVDPSVPETLCFDEKDLAKLVSCIFLNALKFTEAGSITIKTSLNEANRCVLISIRDTGSGIPATFLPKLFQAFSREDGSTTRSKEGLGLGLLVAKGLSRRLGGDLTCVHSSTTKPDRGSEFEIRLPMYPNERVSRPATPYMGTPAPSPADSRNSPPEITCSPGGSAQVHQPTASAVGELSSSLPDSLCRPQLASLETDNQDNRYGAPPEGHTPRPAARRPSLASRNSSFLPGYNFDPDLAQKQPLTFLVAEDNKINSKILVSMLGKLGYQDIYEAFDGKEAVRIMSESLSTNFDSDDVSSTDSDMSNTDDDNNYNNNNNNNHKNPSTRDFPGRPAKRKPIDVILMDLWMPYMDGYEATERILNMVADYQKQLENEDPKAYLPPSPTVLAVSADVTDEALHRATAVGITGYMTKPYKLRDLGRLIMDFCVRAGSCGAP